MKKTDRFSAFRVSWGCMIRIFPEDSLKIPQFGLKNLAKTASEIDSGAPKCDFRAFAPKSADDVSMTSANVTFVRRMTSA